MTDDATTPVPAAAPGPVPTAPHDGPPAPPPPVPPAPEPAVQAYAPEPPAHVAPAPVAPVVVTKPAAVDAPTPSQDLRLALAAVRTEVGKSVVGQDAAVSGLVVALVCRGHVLLEGVPGVAKTLLVRSLAHALELSTKRVQFTPDLMPGDVTGSLVYDARTAEFSFRPGPVFTNLLLADEINRTPPRRRPRCSRRWRSVRCRSTASRGRCPTRSW